jgi:hypothetical protein
MQILRIRIRIPNTANTVGYLRGNNKRSKERKSPGPATDSSQKREDEDRKR